MPFGTYVGNFTLTADGTYYIQYRAVDNAGNVESTQVETIKIDKTKPESPQLLIPDNDTWVNTSSVLFDWQDSLDTHSGIANYTLQVSKTSDFSYLNYTAILTTSINTSLPLEDGIYYWRVIVKDNASNSNVSEVWIVKIDTEKPGSPVLITPINNEVTPDNTPTFEWFPVTDTFSELAYYTIQVSTTPYFLPSDIVYEANPVTNYSTPTTTLDNGPYCWRVRAVDNANNVGEWATTTFWVDSNAPTGLILQINNGANYTNSTSVALTISVDNPTESLDYLMCFSNDGVSWSDNESYSTTKTWDLANGLYGGNSTEGKKTVYVRCKKSAGVTDFAQSDSSIILDLTPPEVTLQSPENDTWVNTSSVLFDWQDSLDLCSGIANYTLQVSKTSDFSYLNYTAILTTSINTSLPLEDGIYYWRVIVNDNASNNNISNVWIVKIDTQKPAEPNLYQPADNNITTEMNVTFRWQNLSSNELSGIYQYELQVGTNVFYIPGQNNSTTISLSDGTYNWKIRAADIAGNI
ncbi:MAG: hypothetical protein L6265_11610, partial [Thermoplasmatales archaeon]|nr:hypothetical protein [Thermoplasmatales archaeon]